MKNESLICFAGFKWRILELRDDKALILTNEVIEQQDIHDRKEEVTWETSEIRRYLNNDFLERFTQSEAEAIETSFNQNRDNPWYGSEGGNDTDDKAFLLSLDEIARLYFGDSSRLLDNPKKNQRYWFDRKDENNIKRRATFMNSSWWWWTRTPGKSNKVFTYIHGDGNIGIQGNGVSRTSFTTLHTVTQSNKGGIRPALWVKREYMNMSIGMILD